MRDIDCGGFSEKEGLFCLSEAEKGQAWQLEKVKYRTRNFLELPHHDYFKQL
jgi:hypothetical protein